MAPWRVHIVVGARPNLVKAAPLLRCLRSSDRFTTVLVDTGQHYDYELAGIFRENFSLPDADISLNIGSGTHGQQTARILESYEKHLLEEPPAAVIVIGDINSTLACALAASKLQIAVVHLEAGLRSRDKTMPEEINRIVTDHLADLLWTSSDDANDNLQAEGIATPNIVLVGNIMIDSLRATLPRAIGRRQWESFDLQPQQYVVVTLHRPSNVDTEASLKNICETIGWLADRIPVMWPLHPRTRARIDSYEMSHLLEHKNVIYSKPLGYIEFQSLVAMSKFVVTDSGGLQEETSWLGVPCITLRPNTERPITVEKGTNILVTDRNSLKPTLQRLLDANMPVPQFDMLSVAEVYRVHLFWDGHTAERCAESLTQFLEQRVYDSSVGV